MAGPIIYLLLLALCHAGASQNSTQPQHKIVGWQPNSGRRGTLNIIQNCIFTILACTWSIQHPNLPGKDDTPRKMLKRQCIWTVLNIIAPEFLLAQAIGNYLWVRAIKKRLDKRSEKDKKKESSFPRSWWRRFNDPPDLESGNWTPKHIYYGNMGGFVVSLDPKSIPDAEKSSDAVEKSADEAGSSNAAGKSSSSGRKSPNRSEQLSKGLLRNFDGGILKAAVTTDQYLQYVMGKDHADNPNVLPKPPPLAKMEIEDKDKGSPFAKMIAIMQIAGLSLSLLARKISDLGTTQLEIMTLAFGVCAILTSLTQWPRPQRVTAATQVPYQFGREIPANPPPRFYHLVTH
ncbi:MAG: hypothetical protein M1840_008067 [Geoglossum simile]|nr:MAG: hypothetical protein M1840_008067 [Geoglossum simile]